MKITEDNFDEVFKPQQNHLDDNASFDGCAYETYGEELEYVRKIAQENPKRVWTIIEVDGIMYYTTGYHLVNRYMYLVCEVEFTEEMDVKLWSPEDDEEGGEDE